MCTMYVVTKHCVLWIPLECTIPLVCNTIAIDLLSEFPMEERKEGYSRLYNSRAYGTAVCKIEDRIVAWQSINNALRTRFAVVNTLLL